MTITTTATTRNCAMLALAIPDVSAVGAWNYLSNFGSNRSGDSGKDDGAGSETKALSPMSSFSRGSALKKMKSWGSSRSIQSLAGFARDTAPQSPKDDNEMKIESPKNVDATKDKKEMILNLLEKSQTENREHKQSTLKIAQGQADKLQESDKLYFSAMIAKETQKITDQDNQTKYGDILDATSASRNARWIYNKDSTDENLKKYTTAFGNFQLLGVQVKMFQDRYPDFINATVDAETAQHEAFQHERKREDVQSKRYNWLSEIDGSKVDKRFEDYTKSQDLFMRDANKPFFDAPLAKENLEKFEKSVDGKNHFEHLGIDQAHEKASEIMQGGMELREVKKQGAEVMKAFHDWQSQYTKYEQHLPEYYREQLKDLEATVKHLEESYSVLKVFQEALHAKKQDPLPEGWDVAFDPKSGRAYYANTKTEETTWDRPASHE